VSSLRRRRDLSYGVMGAGATITALQGLMEVNTTEVKAHNAIAPAPKLPLQQDKESESKSKGTRHDSKTESERETKCRERSRKSRITQWMKFQNESHADSSALNHREQRELKQKQRPRSELKGYYVKDTLRQTVMGCVKRCVRLEDGLECVLKISRVNRGSDDNTIENPLKEVMLLKKIGSSFENKSAHPNVIRLVDWIQKPNAVWAVMEYAAGGDLFDLIAEHGPLFEDEGRDILRQCGNAVAFMHDKGVAHLDLSLENILIHHNYNEGMVVKIIDFGMAQEINKVSNLNFSVQRPGKPSYMAPEVHNGRKFDPERADAFSLGVVYFTMLTGVPPFRLASSHDKRFKFVVGSSTRIKRICDRWKRPISEEAANFLSVLITHVEDRVTVKTMVTHKYLYKTKETQQQNALEVVVDLQTTKDCPEEKTVIDNEA